MAIYMVDKHEYPVKYGYKTRVLRFTCNGLCAGMIISDLYFLFHILHIVDDRISVNSP